MNTDWSAVFAQPAGKTSLMVAGIGMIAAGGVSWIPSAPDFARYLPRTASAKAIVGNSIGGAGIVVLPMVLMGAVMAVSTPDLASAADPVSFLGEILPMWIAVPYLLIALVGMLLINSMSMYSAGFTAQTLGFKIPRALGGLRERGDLAGLRRFPDAGRHQLHGLVHRLPLAARRRLLGLGRRVRRGHAAPHGVRRARRCSTPPAPAPTGTRAASPPPRVIAWAVGLLGGLMFTKSDWFTGPLAANNPVGEYGLGWVATIVISGLLYVALPKPRRGGPRSPAEEAKSARDSWPSDASSATVPLRPGFSGTRPAKGDFPCRSRSYA